MVISCFHVYLVVLSLKLFLLQVRLIKPFKRYVYDVANFVEWAIYILSFVYFVPLSDKNDVQIGAGSIAVFLAWINFTMFLKRFYDLGIYIIMAKEVFKSIVKVEN